MGSVHCVHNVEFIIHSNPLFAFHKQFQASQINEIVITHTAFAADNVSLCAHFIKSWPILLAARWIYESITFSFEVLYENDLAQFMTFIHEILSRRRESAVNTRLTQFAIELNCDQSMSRIDEMFDYDDKFVALKY